MALMVNDVHCSDGLQYYDDNRKRVDFLTLPLVALILQGLCVTTILRAKRLASIRASEHTPTLRAAYRASLNGCRARPISLALCSTSDEYLKRCAQRPTNIFSVRSTPLLQSCAAAPLFQLYAARPHDLQYM